MFYVVQPYSDGPNRFREATIVSTHATADEAFVELERVAVRLRKHGLPGDVIELYVVDEQRLRIERGS